MAVIKLPAEQTTALKAKAAAEGLWHGAGLTGFL
jgi:hypothetical protein